MSGERILLTGASGFLGSRLAILAADRSWRVWATYLSHPAPDAPGVIPVRLDLAESGAEIGRLLAEAAPTAVIHAAYSMSDARLNIEATDRLTSACAAMERPPFFLYTSTDLVFDGRRGGYTENDEPNPIMEYGRQKLEAERIVSRTLPESAIVRPSLIYDLQRVPRHLDFAVRASGHGEDFSFFEDEYRCPVLADELAAVILELCGHRLSGTWHTGGADRVDRWWFGVRMLKTLGYPTAHARRGRSACLPGERPADCSLDCGKLNSALKIELSGARQVLGHLDVEDQLWTR